MSRLWLRRGQPGASGDLSAATAVLLAFGVGIGVLQVPGAGGESPESPSAPVPAAKRQVEVKSNDPCYVCHMPFVEECLAVAHAKAKVWCGTCHGPSTRHIEDEYIGATPPDVVYKRCQVDRMCGRCHEAKKHPKLTAKTRSDRLAAAKKAQRKIKGRKVEVTGVCTDCHGRHWIPPREPPDQSAPAVGASP